MPIYEYRCDVCDHELEVLQSVTAEPLKECPSCLEQSLRKKISAGNFRLYGDGFYAPSARD